MTPPKDFDLKIATDNEAEDLIRLSTAFFEASPYAKFGVSKKKVAETVHSFVNGNKLELMPIALMHGSKAVGVLAAIANENIFNRRKVCMELIWWVDPEYRGYKQAKMMVDAYEYWAKVKIDAQIVQLVSLEWNDMGKFYTKLGYEKAESAYIKEI